ncbi:ATP-binding cassette domain-containing protein [Chromobacterium vaccinii]|nr:ATP-binding cassette domain-containing protein [Chromobacterium vaccinii]MBX9359213.1 ATP-binding cassette domain-containing protein [Chromobacterium vaccinii]
MLADRLKCRIHSGTLLLSPHRPGRPHGCGKSLLGQLLAGQIAPHARHVLRGGGIHLLPQELDPDTHPTVAHLAGMAETLAALRSVRDGSLDERDYQLLQDHWDCESSFQQLLPDAGLNGISPDTPSAALSGGEAMRVALAARLCATPAP